MKEWWRREKNKWLITNMYHYLEDCARADRLPKVSSERWLAWCVS